MENIATEDLLSNIASLQRKRKELYDLITHNGQQTIACIAEIYRRKYNLVPGQTVIESAGVDYLVKDVMVRVESDPEGKPWVAGYPRRKGSDSFATIVRNVFSEWTIKTP